MKKLIAIIAILFSFTLIACSSKSDAIKAAHKAGWKEVRVISSAYWLNWTCSNGEKAYKIEGISPNGKRTTATVCCGHTHIGKQSCTIRY